MLNIEEIKEKLNDEKISGDNLIKIIEELNNETKEIEKKKIELEAKLDIIKNQLNVDFAELSQKLGKEINEENVREELVKLFSELKDNANAMVNAMEDYYQKANYCKVTVEEERED